jgi:hypothetical protein
VPRSPSTHPAERQGQGERSRSADSSLRRSRMTRGSVVRRSASSTGPDVPVEEGPERTAAIRRYGTARPCSDAGDRRRQRDRVSPNRLVARSARRYTSLRGTSAGDGQELVENLVDRRGGRPSPRRSDELPPIGGRSRHFWNISRCLEMRVSCRRWVDGGRRRREQREPMTRAASSQRGVGSASEALFDGLETSKDLLESVVSLRSCGPPALLSVHDS